MRSTRVLLRAYTHGPPPPQKGEQGWGGGGGEGGATLASKNYRQPLATILSGTMMRTTRYNECRRCRGVIEALRRYKCFPGVYRTADIL
jgi:hypothetical protein